MHTHEHVMTTELAIALYAHQSIVQVKQFGQQHVDDDVLFPFFDVLLDHVDVFG